MVSLMFSLSLFSDECYCNTLLLGGVFTLKMSPIFCVLTLFVNSEFFYVLLADLIPAMMLHLVD